MTIRNGIAHLLFALARRVDPEISRAFAAAVLDQFAVEARKHPPRATAEWIYGRAACPVMPLPGERTK